jgi:hypothetical protein
MPKKYTRKLKKTRKYVKKKYGGSEQSRNESEQARNETEPIVSANLQDVYLNQLVSSMRSFHITQPQVRARNIPIAVNVVSIIHPLSEVVYSLKIILPDGRILEFHNDDSSWTGAPSIELGNKVCFKIVEEYNRLKQSQDPLLSWHTVRTISAHVGFKNAADVWEAAGISYAISQSGFMGELYYEPSNKDKTGKSALSVELIRQRARAINGQGDNASEKLIKFLSNNTIAFPSSTCFFVKVLSKYTHHNTGDGEPFIYNLPGMYRLTLREDCQFTHVGGMCFYLFYKVCLDEKNKKNSQDYKSLVKEKKTPQNNKFELLVRSFTSLGELRTAHCDEILNLHTLSEFHQAISDLKKCLKTRVVLKKSTTNKLNEPIKLVKEKRDSTHNINTFFFQVLLLKEDGTDDLITEFELSAHLIDRDLFRSELLRMLEDFCKKFNIDYDIRKLIELTCLQKPVLLVPCEELDLGVFAHSLSVEFPEDISLIHENLNLGTITHDNKDRNSLLESLFKDGKIKSKNESEYCQNECVSLCVRETQYGAIQYYACGMALPKDQTKAGINEQNYRNADMSIHTELQDYTSFERNKGLVLSDGYAGIVHSPCASIDSGTAKVITFPKHPKCYIPLCHDVNIDRFFKVKFIDENGNTIEVTSTITPPNTIELTGVEDTNPYETFGIPYIDLTTLTIRYFIISNQETRDRFIELIHKGLIQITENIGNYFSKLLKSKSAKDIRDELKNTCFWLGEDLSIYDEYKNAQLLNFEKEQLQNVGESNPLKPSKLELSPLQFLSRNKLLLGEHFGKPSFGSKYFNPVQTGKLENSFSEMGGATLQNPGFSHKLQPNNENYWLHLQQTEEKYRWIFNSAKDPNNITSQSQYDAYMKAKTKYHDRKKVNESKLQASSVEAQPKIQASSIEAPSKLQASSVEAQPKIQAPSIEAPSELQDSSIEVPSELQDSSIEVPSELQDSSIGAPSELQASSIGAPSELQAPSIEAPSKLSPTQRWRIIGRAIGKTRKSQLNILQKDYKEFKQLKNFKKYRQLSPEESMKFKKLEEKLKDIEKKTLQQLNIHDFRGPKRIGKKTGTGKLQIVNNSNNNSNNNNSNNSNSNNSNKSRKKPS